MDFKTWVEDATRTGCKSALYPPSYDCHGIWDRTFPLLHIGHAADMLVWNKFSVPPRKWRSFEDFKKLEKIKCYFPKVK
jgi:hypothetical protein